MDLLPLVHSLKTFFFTFPVEVFGSSGTISTSLGIYKGKKRSTSILNIAVCLLTINPDIGELCFAQDKTSVPVSVLDFAVTKALGRSP
jgi:hypothetical protein